MIHLQQNYEYINIQITDVVYAEVALPPFRLIAYDVELFKKALNKSDAMFGNFNFLFNVMFMLYMLPSIL